MSGSSSPRIVGIRRYPVKAMVGESLPWAALDDRGLVGDRALAVADGEGRFASLKDTRRFRRRDAVADYGATTRDDGVVEVSRAGSTWEVGDAGLDVELSRACGTPVSVVAEAAVPHHDDGAVSVVGTASLRWCADRWGVDADPRRLRVNLLVETSEPFEEESWLGESLRVGDVTLRVVQRVERCRTIDVAQDGLAEGERWLKRLGAERDLRLAAYADVVEPGVIRLGDTVTRG